MSAYDAYAYRGGPRADHEWNKYYDDNVSRSVVVDGEGRIISRSPYQETAKTYVVESETTEHVYSPRLTDAYRHSSPKNDVKWRRPSTTPTPQVDDFLNKLQIEVSRPHDTKYGTSARTGFGGGGYGHDYNPTANYPDRDYDNYDDYYRKKDSPTGDWNRPVNHATRPTRDANKLGLPTNNIEEAVDYLTGAGSKLSPVTTNHHQPQSGRFVSSSPVLRQDPEEAARRYDYNYDKTEAAPRRYDYNYDKTEAAPRRYDYNYDKTEAAPRRNDYNYDNLNNPSTSPWTRTTVPKTTGPTTTTRAAGIIDSKEAARRYNGKIVRI